MNEYFGASAIIIIIALGITAAAASLPLQLTEVTLIEDISFTDFNELHIKKQRQDVSLGFLVIFSVLTVLFVTVSITV